MNSFILALKEIPSVTVAIFLGLGRDVVKNWWRYIFTFLATFCILTATTPPDLPLILEIPWGIAIMILTVSAVLTPAWRAEYIEDMYAELAEVIAADLPPRTLGEET